MTPCIQHLWTESNRIIKRDGWIDRDAVTDGSVTVSVAMLQSVCFVSVSRRFLAASVAVMSVDLGSEWMKVAIVKPGVPMEIALNK